MLGICTYDDIEQINQELTKIQAQLIQLRQDFTALVEEIKAERKLKK